MYADNIEPRVSLDEASFSQLSATTYSPAMQNPEITRNTIQPSGSTSTACNSTMLEATEANAAKTRIWPTPVTRRGAQMEPNRNPT